MSTTVDQRVVSMQFDNADFEKGVQQTLNSLNTLNKNIEKNAANNVDSFKGLSNGLNDVENSIHKGILPAMDTMQNKFSILGTISDQVLRNMTNTAMSAGRKLIKSLSVDQISSGWEKFGDKTTSVATLVAQGNDLKTVNKELDRLNWFTDETSYNFTDMVSNIAKFTASGKKLNESVTAMEGIANWAAKSGQNAITASRAMYQISQAMGAGIMRKEDYKSIQNASMDTEEFRQKCLDAGVALGTLKKTADGTYQSLMAKADSFTKTQFADHLTQDAWFTSDVMMKVFEDYSNAVNKIYEVTSEKGMLASDVIDEIHETAESAGISIDDAIKRLGYIDENGNQLFDSFGLSAFEAAQKARTFGDAINSVKDAVSTGWMNTFEIIFGDAEEATKLWTGVANLLYDVFASSAATRNEMMKVWKDLGGRTAVIQTLVNLFNAIYSIVKPIGDALHDVFGEMDGKRLAGINKSLADMTFSLIQTENTMAKIYTVAYAVAKALKFVLNLLWEYKKPIIAIYALVTAFSTLRGLLLGGLGFGSVLAILKLIVALGIGAKLLNIKSILNKISPIITIIAKLAYNLFGNISQHISNIIKMIQSANLGTKVQSFLQTVSKIASDLFKNLNIDLSRLDAFKFNNLQGALKTISGLFSGMFLGFTNGLKAFNQLTDVLNPLTHLSKVFDTTGRMATNANKSFNKTSGAFTMVAYAAEKAEMPIYNVATKTVTMADSVEQLGTASAESTANFNGFIATIQAYLSNLEKTYPVLRNLVEFIKTMDLQKLLAIGVMFLYMRQMKLIQNAIKGVGNVLDKFGVKIDNITSGIVTSIKDLNIAIKGTFGSITNYFNSLTKENNLKNFKNLAIGIGLIAASVAALGFALQYLNPNALIAATVAIAGLSVVVLGVSWAMARISKSINPVGIAALGGALLLFSIALAEIVATVTVLSLVMTVLVAKFKTFDAALEAFNLPLKALNILVWAVVDSLGIFAGALVALGVLSPAISKGCSALLKMAVSLGAFTGSAILFLTSIKLVDAAMQLFIDRVSSVVATIKHFVGGLMVVNDLTYTIQEVGKVVVSFLAFIGIGFLVVKTFSYIANELANATTEFAISVIAIAAAVNILVKALLNLSTYSGDVGETFFLLSGALALLILTVRAIQELDLTKIANDFSMLAKGFLKLSIAMLVLTGAIKAFGNMDPGVFSQGMAAYIVVLTGMVIALKQLDTVNIGKIATGVISLVAAMYLLTPLFALYGVAWQPMVTGILLISGAMLALSKSVQLMSSADPLKTLGNVSIMMTAALGLAYICVTLSNIPIDKAIVAVGALGSMFLILGVFTKVLANISKKVLTTQKSIGRFMQLVLSLAFITGVLTTAIYVLASLPVDRVLDVASGLSIAMLAFSGAIVLLAMATQILNGSNIIGVSALMGVFAIAVGVLAFAIYQLQDVPFEVFTGFSLAILAFGGAIAIVTAVIGIFSAALVAASPFMLTLAAVLISLGAAFLSFGAASVMFGIGAAAVGIGASLIITALSGLIVVLQSFIPTLQNFIQFISDISSNAKDVAAMSASLTLLGRALTILAVGMGATSLAGVAFAGALYLVGKGCTVFAAGLTLAGHAAVSFAQNVKVAFSVLAELAGKGIEWGKHITESIASGLSSGIRTVGDAALGVAKTIWGYLHQSDAEWGPLKGVWTWGAHLVENIGSGMAKKTGWLADVAQAVGLSEKTGFENGAAGTGSSTISNIVSELFGGIDSISAAGASGGAAYMKAFLNQIKGVGGYNKEAVARGQAKRKGQFKDLTFDRDEAPINGNHGKAGNASASFLKLDDFVNKFTGDTDNATDATDGLTDSLGGLGGAADSAGKSTGGAGSSASDAAEAEKEAAEAAKIHAKYLQYLDGTATQYMHTSGVLNETVDNTSAWEKSKSAIADLAKEMYEASLTGDETADELAKKQQKIEEAFVKSYETIRDKIKDSLDLMKAFDLQTSSITKSSTILKNMQSQFLGNAELASRQQLLAQMGLDDDYLQELIKKGSEGLPEINSLLRMSRTEIQQFNRGLADRKGWSEFIAQNGLAAIASAKHNQQLRATVKTQDEQIAKAKEINTTYIDISQKAMSTTGVVVNVMNGALNGLANEFTQIANEMGVTTDQLTSYVNGTALTVEQASLKQIDNYNEVKKAFIEYSDTVGTESDRIKNALSNLSTSFDELKLLSDDDETFSITDMQDNIESQIDGINTWSSEITDLAGRISNTDLLQQLADMGTSGYKYVHALYEASDEELDEFVASFEEKMQTIESVSQTYGNQMGLNVVEGINSSLTTYFQQLQNGGDQSFGELASLINKHLEAIGQQGGTGLSSGIQSTQDTVIGSAKILANDLEASVAAVVNQDTGYKKTSDYMLGMLQGLRDYKDDVMREIDEITSAMEDHTADGLDVHSPSRFTKWVGKNLILGFIKGFSENEDSLMTSMDSIVNNMKDAIDTAYDILTTDGDMNPTITPVLDLSDIQNRSKSIGSLLSSKSLNLNAKLGTVHTANENTAKLNEMLQGMNAQNNKGGNSYNFVQNNYSPKALSRLEIYRQTKNQFAQMKGVVNSNG